MSRLRKLSFNTSTQFLSWGVQSLLGFFAVPIIIGEVGKEQFGLLLLSGTVMGYFSLFNFGVPAGVKKYVAHYHALGDRLNLNKVINSCFFLFCAIGLIVCSAVLLFVNNRGMRVFNISEANLPVAYRLLTIAAAFALLSWPATVLGSVLDGFERFDLSNLSRGVGSVVSVSSAIFAARLHYPIEVIFLLQNVGSLLTWVLQYWSIRRLHSQWRFSVNDVQFSTLKTVLSFSLWFLLFQIATLLEYKTDHVILGLYLSVGMISVYHVISRPIRFVQEMSHLATSVIMPSVSGTLAKEGREGLDRYIYSATRYHNLFFAPIAIIGIFLSKPFITLWMGPDFAEYAWIAQVACAFQLIIQSNNLLGEVFTGAGIVRRPALLTLGIAILNVGASLLLVRHFGIPGVIMGTLVAGTVATLLWYLFMFPDLRINRVFYMKSVILKAQVPYWITAIAVASFAWSDLQGIHSWQTLFGAAGLMSLVLYLIGWVFGVEHQIKGRMYEQVKSAVSGAMRL